MGLEINNPAGTTFPDFKQVAQPPNPTVTGVTWLEIGDSTDISEFGGYLWTWDQAASAGSGLWLSSCMNRFDFTGPDSTPGPTTTVSAKHNDVAMSSLKHLIIHDGSPTTDWHVYIQQLNFVLRGQAESSTGNPWLLRIMSGGTTLYTMTMPDQTREVSERTDLDIAGASNLWFQFRPGTHAGLGIGGGIIGSQRMLGSCVWRYSQRPL